MSQAQILADEASPTTKQMVVIKEKLKLDRSATNAQAANYRQINLLDKNKRKNRKKVQNRVGRKTKFAGKQLKGQETGNISVVVLTSTRTIQSVVTGGLVPVTLEQRI